MWAEISASVYVYIYMCATSVTLRNAIKSPVTFLIRVITMYVRSVYVLLLKIYIYHNKYICHIIQRKERKEDKIKKITNK